jgi:hypothetical protein
MDEATAKRRALHYMLTTALVEIRAAESLNAAVKFADVFHNLPMRLLDCTTAADFDAEYTKVLERSKLFGLEEYVQNLMKLATASVPSSGKES